MGLKNFFNDSPLFNPRFSLGIHITQFILVTAAVILSFVRMRMNVPTTRANTMALSMGAKSLIIISYEILTEHVAKLRRWRSFKANAILNCIEVVLWAAVVFMVFRANLNSCTGTSCIISWVVCGLAGVLHMLALQTAIASILDFRYFKKCGVPRSERKKESDSESDPEMQYM